MDPLISNTSSEESLLLTGDIWWETNKRRVIFGAIALVLFGLGVFAWLWYQHARKADAIRAFASANSIEELQLVASKFSVTPAADNARLLIAARERTEGNVDASNAAYEAILKRKLGYTLMPAAALGLAENAQHVGRDNAIELFQQASTRFPNSFVAPFALFSEGEMLLIAHNTEAATRVFRNLVVDYPNSPSAQLASMQLQRLNGLRKVGAK